MSNTLFTKLRECGGEATVLWSTRVQGDEVAPNLHYALVYGRQKVKGGSHPPAGAVMIREHATTGMEVFFSSESNFIDDDIQTILLRADKEKARVFEQTVEPAPVPLPHWSPEYRLDPHVHQAIDADRKDSIWCYVQVLHPSGVFGLGVADLGKGGYSPVHPSLLTCDSYEEAAALADRLNSEVLGLGTDTTRLIVADTIERNRREIAGKEWGDVSTHYLSIPARDTILAALRYYQQNGQGNPMNRSDDIQDIATGGTGTVSLNESSIDDLCEHLNQ